MKYKKNKIYEIKYDLGHDCIFCLLNTVLFKKIITVI